jgi:hypothetical protein
MKKIKVKNRKDYVALFIKESNTVARLGKTVYVRKEFHDRIQKIVQVIGNNEVSLSGYIDNVLALHFENYKEDISQLYRQKISNDVF